MSVIVSLHQAMSTGNCYACIIVNLSYNVIKYTLKISMSHRCISGVKYLLEILEAS